jgi:hypothetical protein
MDVTACWWLRHHIQASMLNMHVWLLLLLLLQGRVDDMLPLALFDVLQTGFMCLGVFVLVAAAVPFILPVFVLLLVIFYYFR